MLTNLDVISYLSEIPVFTAYRIQEETTGRFPTSSHLEAAAPVYEALPGWETDILTTTDWADLPGHTMRYVERVESLIECPIRYLSVDPERQQFFER